MTARVVRNKFYVSEISASKTPSRADGISEDNEKKQRAFVCGLVQETGVALRLPQVAMATAQVIFHRFYHRGSMKKVSHLWLATAALFLAAKVEEVPRNIRDVITTLHNRFLRNQIKRHRDEYGYAVAFPLDRNSSSFVEWRREVTKMEMILLKELGFVLHVEHPHKFILVYVNAMKEHSGIDEQGSKRWTDLLQRAWNYANDALRTDLCVRVEPEAIACGCIKLASLRARVVLPESANESWWMMFGVNEEELSVVQLELERLYEFYSDSDFEDLTGRGLVADIMQSALKQKRSAIVAEKLSALQAQAGARQQPAVPVAAKMPAAGLTPSGNAAPEKSSVDPKRSFTGNGDQHQEQLHEPNAVASVAGERLNDQRAGKTDDIKRPDSTNSTSQEQSKGVRLDSGRQQEDRHDRRSEDLRLLLDRRSQADDYRSERGYERRRRRDSSHSRPRHGSRSGDGSRSREPRRKRSRSKDRSKRRPDSGGSYERRPRRSQSPDRSYRRARRSRSRERRELHRR